MTPESATAAARDTMDGAIEHLQKEFTAIRTGKASPALVENLDIHVESYGSQMKLKELAVITTPEARMIMVQPFDPSVANDIDRGIRESKLGFNPVNEGKVLRIPIPELTEERRKELVKQVKKVAEEAEEVVTENEDGIKAVVPEEIEATKSEVEKTAGAISQGDGQKALSLKAAAEANAKKLKTSESSDEVDEDPEAGEAIVPGEIEEAVVPGEIEEVKEDTGG